MFHLCGIYSIVNKASNRLGIENTLAFDAEHLSAVNSVDILMKVIKHTIIHGYQFYDALEHALDQGVSWADTRTLYTSCLAPSLAICGPIKPISHGDIGPLCSVANAGS